MAARRSMLPAECCSSRRRAALASGLAQLMLAMPMFDAVLRCGWQAHTQRQKRQAALELAACKTLASGAQARLEEPHFDRTLRVAFQRMDGPAS